MANPFYRLFNFPVLKDYRWRATDFNDFQTNGLVALISGLLQGLENGAVLQGLDFVSSSGLNFTVSSGIAVGPSGSLLVIPNPVTGSFVSPTGLNEYRQLAVVCPNILGTQIITPPTMPLTTAPLTWDNYGQVLTRNVASAANQYAATGPNDVVLFGVRLNVGATGFLPSDLDFEVRDIEGKNSSTQHNLARYDQRLRPYRSTTQIIGIKPSQTINGNTSGRTGTQSDPKLFTYINSQIPSIFPKTAGAFTPQDTFLNFQTGAIIGGDATTPAFSPTIPSAGSCIVATVGLQSNDTLAILFGTSGTYAQCQNAIYNQLYTGAGGLASFSNAMPICYVILQSADGVNIADLDIIDARSILNYSPAQANPSVTFTTFTYDGTFACPAGVTSVQVTAQRNARPMPQFNPNYNGNSSPTVQMILSQDGSVYSWGSNANGQLGIGSVTAQSSPVIVNTSFGWNFKKIVVDQTGTSAFGITSQGFLYSWGLNTQGQLGIASNNAASQPTVVSGPVKFQDVVPFENSVIGLSENGVVYGWGDNTDGQNGTTGLNSSPVAVVNFPAGTVIKKIYGIIKSAFALSTTGILYSWGAGATGNNTGALGNGSLANQFSASLVLGGLTFQDIKYGYNPNEGNPLTVVGLTTGGQLYAWGGNTNGQLGIGSVATQSSPVLVVGGLTFTSFWVSQYGANVFALSTNGNLYGWGVNADGQLLQGNVTPYSSPVLVLSSPTIVDFATLGINQNIDAGGYGCAVAYINGSNQIYAWGNNTKGYLGNGNTTAQSTPVAVAGGLSAVRIFSAGDSFYALTAAGATYSWGNNSFGQLGNGNVTAQSSPVLVLGGVVAWLRPDVYITAIPTTAGANYSVTLSQYLATFGTTILSPQMVDSVSVTYIA